MHGDNPDAVADLHPIAVEARRCGLIIGRELSAMKERKDASKIVSVLLAWIVTRRSKPLSKRLKDSGTSAVA